MQTEIRRLVAKRAKEFDPLAAPEEFRIVGDLGSPSLTGGLPEVRKHLLWRMLEPQVRIGAKCCPADPGSNITKSLADML
jgi:hypothetical protein